MVPDPSTFSRLKAGEPSAYEWLVTQYEAPLFRFFLCDHRDFHLAQEQSAETFSQLVRSIPSTRGDHQQLPAFVFAVARHVKARQWRRATPVHAPLDQAANVPDPSPPAEAALADQEQLHQLFDALAEFPPEVREILLLRFVEGTSLDRVSQIVKMPLGTVKSHVHRAIARLKATFAEAGKLT